MQDFFQLSIVKYATTEKATFNCSEWKSEPNSEEKKISVGSKTSRFFRQEETVSQKL